MDRFEFIQEEYLLTIFINTRNSVELLKKNLHSLLSLSDTSVNNYEIIIKVDFDDEESLEFIKTFTNSAVNVNFIVNSRREGYLSLHESLNKAAGMAQGKYMLLLPTDCEILTQNWNVELENILNEFKIYFLNYNKENKDGSITNVKDIPIPQWVQDRKYVKECGVGYFDFLFPIFPTKLKELWGFISPHALSDNWLGDMAKRINSYPYNENFYEFIDSITIYLQYSDSKPINNNNSKKLQETYASYINDEVFFTCANRVVEYKKYERWRRAHELNIVNDFRNSNKTVQEYFNLPK